MNLCTACGSQNPAGSAFCVNCGTALKPQHCMPGIGASIAVCCSTAFALLMLMMVVGALVWGERHTTNPRSMLTLSTVGVFVWLYWRRGSFAESMKWTAAYAGLQLGYGLVVQRVIALVKTTASGDSQLAAWSLFLGLLWTIAPAVPILFLRRRLFPQKASKPEGSPSSASAQE